MWVLRGLQLIRALSSFNNLDKVGHIAIVELVKVTGCIFSEEVKIARLVLCTKAKSQAAHRYQLTFLLKTIYKGKPKGHKVATQKSYR